MTNIKPLLPSERGSAGLAQQELLTIVRVRNFGSVDSLCCPRLHSLTIEAIHPNLTRIEGSPRSLAAFPTPFAGVSTSLPVICILITLLMSTSVDNRRRPNLWSYISFGSTPRRRSISLPTRKGSVSDPYEKADRHSASQSTHSVHAVHSFKDGWMSQSPRSRALKTVGIIVFFVFLFLLLARKEGGRVKDFVDGLKPSANEPTSEC